MEYTVMAGARVLIEQTKNWPEILVKEVSFGIDATNQGAKQKFTDRLGQSTKEGVQYTTFVFLEALVANIHYGHKKGYWDKDQHFQHIHDKLDKEIAQFEEIQADLG
jgi:hypothetical protein